ncbi:class A sortase [Enterococcus ureilyticus]|uniref:Class A sortase n=1 Tax=Enterococcus ureilyticus TaxID=1131292 RepID=A0A1E5HB81_9ENTE|nr:class A sortase [Enterococcus ureilyticus]MBM7690087.1 sortase A [Enterococcus ureilyticus]MBO0446780.1 class A sortase [Enterococcus ureilyticus]OEG22219.1 class A sortase [Enterococcus ureilyticus]
MASRKERPKKKKSKKRNWLINIFLFLLLVVGLALVFNTQIRNWLIQQNGKEYAVEKLTPEIVAKNNQTDTSFDFEAVESLSTEAVLKAQLANKNLPVVGAVALPDVKINLPIFRGLDNVVLLTGAGTMKPDQEMGKGNYALASHRVQDMISLFSPLEYSKPGELIYTTDLNNVYTYKITYVEKIDPSRVELIDDVPGKKMITLITCGDMYATTRIAVQGELETVTPMKEATQAMTDAFNMEQLTL